MTIQTGFYDDGRNKGWSLTRVVARRASTVLVYTVRDRSAPGAGFCLRPSISVYGPGLFGSGSLFCLERNIIVCGLGPLGSGSRYWSHIRSGTVSL